MNLLNLFRSKPQPERLLAAVESDDLQTVSRLIAGGANVNCATPDGWTPLLIAVTGQPLLVKLLLKHGADPNIASARGYTPLMRAGGKGQSEVVRLLLAAGADPLLRDCDGETALRLTTQQGELDCAALIAAAQDSAPQLRRDAPAPSATSELVPLPRSALAMIDLTRRSVGGVVRWVSVGFADGTRLERVKLIDERLMELPREHASRSIKTVGVPLDQN